MVAKPTIETRVVRRVRGEHDQGLRSRGRRVLDLVSSDILPATATSFAVTVITAGSAERVFSRLPCRGSTGFQFSLLATLLLAVEGLLSMLFRRSTSCGAFGEIGRYAVD
jgi:hypothetical protein